MDRMHAMEMFVRVVEAGSLSAAARDLRVGQPAVSKAVAALEERLGVRLLIRSSRQLTVTEAGQAFFDSAVRAIAEADEAETAARGAGAGLEGRLRVCAPVTFARLHIARRLGGFLDQHPRLRLELVMDDRNVDLFAEHIDVAFRLGDLADSALTARKIAEADRLVVATPDYVARHGAPTGPEDLLAHNAIVYGQLAGGTDWRFRKGTSELSVAVNSRTHFTAAEGVREAVKAGLGVALVSRWMMEPELTSGAVMPLLPGWTMNPMRLWAVFPAGRMPSSKARVFVDWLSAQLAIQ
jgi:DNA-binding transcriptional LysR family regulator